MGNYSAEKCAVVTQPQMALFKCCSIAFAAGLHWSN